MARRRMIDPMIWEDEGFGSLSDKAKVFFIACISNADDDGRLNANPLNLRALAFRYEEISVKRIEELCFEVGDKIKNFILYDVNGCKYIQLHNWDKYQIQRDDRRKPSEYPVCPQDVNQMSDKCLLKLSKVKLSKDSTPPQPNPLKNLFLEFVLLSEPEHRGLVDKFGDNLTNQYIQRLNDYIGSKGVKYKSHYHTILTWARKDEPINKPKVHIQKL
jgi:hypothetical protein